MCEECGMAYSFVFGTQFHKADCLQRRPKVAEDICPVCGDTPEWCPKGGRSMK